MGNVLEGKHLNIKYLKISLICLIHYPELVTTKPLVEEVDRGDDLQLTSASIVLSSLCAKWSSKAPEMDTATVYVCSVTPGQGRFWLRFGWGTYWKTL